jgi:hypothetical protein
MLLIQSFRAEPKTDAAPIAMLQPPKASPAG